MAKNSDFSLFFAEWLEIQQKIETPWHMPSIEDEKPELIRQAKDMVIPYRRLLQAFLDGKLVKLSDKDWEKLENTDSNYPLLSWKQVKSWKKDWKSIKKAFEEGTSLPAPIVLLHNDKLILVGGNTRLSIAKLMHKKPKIWLIKL
jgi:hypothetical protein